MGRIFCFIGKSSSGKDTLFQKIISSNRLHLKKLVPYTTRPIRDGEKDGAEYFFTTEEQLNIFLQENKVIELRSYHTIYGIWKYFTVKDHQIDLDQSDYAVIGTLESLMKMKEYFGSDNLVPIYIEVEDGIRLQRALDRERMQDQPKYAEMCRRFLADEDDFSPKNLADAGINHIIINDDLIQTSEEIIDYISGFISGGIMPI